MDFSMFFSPEKPRRSVIRVSGVSYEVLRLLQSGGFAQVFEVKQFGTNQQFALKITKNEFSEFAKVEIRTMKELSHSPRIVQLVSYDYTGTAIYTLMELGGLDFFDYTKGCRLTNPTLRRAYFRQMCLCVLQIHEAGKIHRDVKRENFLTFLPSSNCHICEKESAARTSNSSSLLDTAAHFWSQLYPSSIKCTHKYRTIQDDDEEMQLKLADFGCTIDVPNFSSSRLCEIQTTDQVGTDEYLSPESVKLNSKGVYRWSQKSDIWALGVILFEMTWGRRPFPTRASIIKTCYPRNNAPAIGVTLPNVDDPNEEPVADEIELNETRTKELYEIIKWCLQIQPLSRPSIHQLLEHPYLLPTPPSSGIRSSVSTSIEAKRLSESENIETQLSMKNDSKLDESKINSKKGMLISLQRSLSHAQSPFKVRENRPPFATPHKLTHKYSASLDNSIPVTPKNIVQKSSEDKENDWKIVCTNASNRKLKNQEITTPSKINKRTVAKSENRRRNQNSKSVIKDIV